MALTAYLAATNRLLQNPVSTPPLYTTSDLTSYINEGRQQLAGDSQCIRASSFASLSAFQQLYPFSLFSTFPSAFTQAAGYIQFASNPSPGDTVTLNGVIWTFVNTAPVGNQTQIQGTTGFTIVQLGFDLLASTNALLTVAAYIGNIGPPVRLNVTFKNPGTVGNSFTLTASAGTPSGATLSGGGSTNIAGIASAITVKQLSVSSGGVIYKSIPSKPWPWFERYYLANGVAQVGGTPAVWSQQGQGSSGTFGVGPPPALALFVQADCVCLPIPLADDTTAEALPYPFTDAIPYYAAYKAYLSSQRASDATTMLGRYKEFVRRAVEMSSPDVLPMNFLGGRGAQMVSTKQSLTDQTSSKAQQ